MTWIKIRSVEDLNKHSEPYVTVESTLDTKPSQTNKIKANIQQDSNVNEFAMTNVIRM